EEGVGLVSLYEILHFRGLGHFACGLLASADAGARYLRRSLAKLSLVVAAGAGARRDRTGDGACGAHTHDAPWVFPRTAIESCGVAVDGALVLRAHAVALTGCVKHHRFAEA